MKLHCRHIVCLLMAGLLGVVALTPMANGQATTTPTADEREVNFTVSVTNTYGLPIKGLKPEHFKVSSDKKPQQVTAFSEANEPISIEFLVDTSGSTELPTIQGNRLRFAIRGIKDFLQASNEANEYSILSFSNEAHLVLDWTHDRQVVGKSLANLAGQPPKGYTAFYDACRQGMDMMRRASHRKRVIILLGDGEDNVSKDSWLGKLKREIRGDAVAFYSVSITSLARAGAASVVGQDALSDLAKLTGGTAFFPIDQSGVDGVFELLAMMLQNQYAITFKPSQPADDKWHEIKIEIKLPPNAPSELRYPVAKYRAGYLDRAAHD